MALPGARYFSSTEMRALISRLRSGRLKAQLPIPLHQRERLAFVFFLLAFAFAGWKIASLKQPSAFASQQSFLPVSAADLTQARPAPNPYPQTGLQKSFVSSVPGLAVHAASMVELRDASLRAVWFSGSREGAGDVTIKSAVMDPVTLQWGPEHTLYDRDTVQKGLWRYVKKLGNPVIARAPDGSLMLWMVTVSVGGWAGSSITWARSEDEGATWGKPQRLMTSPFLNISTLVKGAPFFYQNGDIGLPVYHEFVTKLGEILRLDSGGRVQDKVRLPGSQTDLQPVVLVADAQHAQAYMRSGHAQAVMMSSTQDAGQTWAPSRAIAWPNPDSALAGAVSAQGDQWLALNPGLKNRGILAVLATARGGSFDGVKPVIVESASHPDARVPIPEYERLLAAQLKASGANQAETQAYIESAKRQLCHAEACSEEFSYPFLLQSRDGALNLVYTWHRSRIRYVRLPAVPSAPAAAPLESHATVR